MLKYHDLFLKQSYSDSYEEYNRMLNDENYSVWDYVVLTASNEAQADMYRKQLDLRSKTGMLNNHTKYLVIADVNGKRIGSGGATLNVLREIRKAESSFDNLKMLVIHSGGDSKRIPQYSACGKLFSPVPRELKNGKNSTLFDELLIESASVCPRLGNGMLVCSGDVLLLFNPLQIDYYGADAAVFTIKEDVKTGCNHGVFLSDTNGFVGQFLHKQREEKLRSLGAVDKKNRIHIDTGAVFFSANIIEELYSLVSTPENAKKYINDKVRLSFYADFLFPMATAATLEEYQKETPEGEFCTELTYARNKLWELLHPHKMKMLCFSPAVFLHFGTVKEFLGLMTKDLTYFSNLGWKNNIATNVSCNEYSCINSFIYPGAKIGKGTYIENSIISSDTVIGKNCIISGVNLTDKVVPDDTVLHGLKLEDGNFTVRYFGIEDNPKENKYFSQNLNVPLWEAELFPVCKSSEEAIRSVLYGQQAAKYISLKTGFNEADTSAILDWQEKIYAKVQKENFLKLIKEKFGVNDAQYLQLKKKLTSKTVRNLIKHADKLPPDSIENVSEKIRTYCYLASNLTGENDNSLLDKCYAAISEAILSADKPTIGLSSCIISKENTEIKLPVRINFGGGWSDTPPYCIENGGIVLNAALKLEGKYPIIAKIEKISDKKIIFAGKDNNSYKEFNNIDELKNYGDPFDIFALHKAVLISVGLISLETNVSLEELINNIGGGFRLTTDVINIPRGSGLGTSSILAAACVKALYDFFGQTVSPEECCSRVLAAEQLMSTGGGWQDQLGALIPGVKLISTKPGLKQQYTIKQIDIPVAALKELESRMCLIYTGQRRLARNLLRDIIGNYIVSDMEIIYALREIQNIAVLMQFCLENGDIDGFASLLDRHWEMSKIIDVQCTNTCIDMIFKSIEDLICGKMICGAGGGGFLQVILKKGVSKRTLIKRLDSVFADAGPKLWDFSFEI